MLELLFIALFQATAGPPEAPPPQQAETTNEQTQAQQEEEERQRAAEERRCRQRQLTGTRLSTVITCGRGNGGQNQDTQAAMHDLQRPTGLQGN